MKLINILFKFFIGLLIFVSIAYLYLTSNYNAMFKNDRFIQIQKSIENSKNKNYTELISVYNRINNFKKESHNSLGYRNLCPCLDVIKSFGYPLLYTEGSSQIGINLSQRIYTKKMEENFTQDECLKFLLSSFDFHYEAKGVEEASSFFFQKDVTDLSQAERITIILLLENSSLYNPIRNKSLSEKIAEYDLILNDSE